MDLLEANPTRIDWFFFSRNPGLFTKTYNVKKIEESPYGESLAMTAFHPLRVNKYDLGLDVDDL